MNKKENLLRTLNGEATGQIPVTPHWWGLYKFEYIGMISGYEQRDEARSLGGEALARIDSQFYEAFQPDMFHLQNGPEFYDESEAVKKEKAEIFRALKDLESRSVIDEYIAAFYPDKDAILKSGTFDHIRFLSEWYKDEVCIVLNEGNPVCDILDPYGCMGFENGLIALIEKPDLMEYLFHRCYEARIPRMEALKECGADAYIASETYCAADLISPSVYHDLLFDAQRTFYQTIDNMGIVPISYFCGNIMPLIEDIKQLGAKGLMVEESKKGMRLDVGEIYERLEGEVCLFGNLDSVHTLLRGSREDVINETRRQISLCNKGGFVMANGSPVPFQTAPENLHAMIETVRAEGKTISL